MNGTKRSRIGFVLCATLLGTVTGCTTYVEGPRYGRVYAQPPLVDVVVQDDYVYYPSYQVYYSNHRHQYIYRDGRSWVSRPAPPHVSVDVLLAAPSVRLDFHDHPSFHHETIARQYPKHWASQGHGRKEGHHDRD